MRREVVHKLPMASVTVSLPLWYSTLNDIHFIQPSKGRSGQPRNTMQNEVRRERNGGSIGMCCQVGDGGKIH